MRQPTYLHILYLLLLLLTINGCNNLSKKSIKEGTIEYTIQFEENKQSKINFSLLPNKLTVKFRNDNTSSKIEGLSGNVNLTFINNVKDKNSIILVNLWNKKLFYLDSLANKDLPNAYAGMPEITIEKTNEVVNFLGYDCKKAIVHCKNASGYSFEILYTNDISIVNPNKNTPFEPIDGVMLKFSIVLHKHLMSISATSVETNDISMDEFSVPSDFERVSKKTIEDLISLMQ